MEINIDNWKEFEVGKLFKVINSKPYHKNEVIVADKEDLSSVNYITRSKFDNGLLYKVEDNKKFDKNPKNTISFGAENADFFIQREEYVTGNKMYYIDTQKLTLNQSLFFKTVLQKTLTNRYGFNDGLTGERLKTEKILLPATYNVEKEEYEPDWDYMEDFIKEIKEENERKLASLKTLFNLENMRGGELDVSDWKEFDLTYIFDEINKGTRLKKEDRSPGNIPLITAGEINNGLSGYIEKNDTLFSGKCLTIDMFGNTFYRKYDFYADDNVIILKNDDISECQLLFIASVVSKITSGYNYKDQFRLNNVNNTKVPLPAIYNAEKEEYEPSWEYMENFITNLQEVVKNQLRRLKQENE